MVGITDLIIGDGTTASIILDLEIVGALTTVSIIGAGIMVLITGVGIMVSINLAGIMVSITGVGTMVFTKADLETDGVGIMASEILMDLTDIIIDMTGLIGIPDMEEEQ